MNSKIGDQWRYLDSGHNIIMEVSEILDDGECRLIIQRHDKLPERIGEYRIWHMGELIHLRGWKFIGNFSKTSNFEELYNLLNS